MERVVRVLMRRLVVTEVVMLWLQEHKQDDDDEHNHASGADRPGLSRPAPHTLRPQPSQGSTIFMSVASLLRGIENESICTHRGANVGRDIFLSG